MKAHTWSRLLLALLMLVPVAILFLLPGRQLSVGSHWFWMALLISFFIILFLLGMPQAEEAEEPSRPAARMLYEGEQPAVIREVMSVQVATEEGKVQRFRGPLREPAESAYEILKRGLPPGTTPLIQEDEQGTMVLVTGEPIAETASARQIRPWVHWLLFGLTLVTTTWAGAAYQGVNLWREPERFAIGLPFSLGLMAILGVHELGHYFLARRHGLRVTPPYFIPVPFALGTFGAFIQMRSPAENRLVLFDVAVAGPLAGLAVAIPALLIGLQSSTIAPAESVGFSAGGTSVGSSVLFALLAKLSLGESLSYGHLLRLGPLAFAGWLGLFITALNLLPVGQLDGGHIVQAIFGRRIGSTIGNLAMWSLLLLALFVWPGLMMWAILVFFVAGAGMPPLNDVTPLTPGRRWLGYGTLVLLGLILAPLPHSFWPGLGIHCPYV